ncbi:hypothetical protein [Pseudomonas sp. IT-P2]|uniref:hypothetical protein n=1 Tax=Pseudomonas sp. IT-P2 TaxID=3026456 RepID=UPI0039E1B14C
MHELFSQTAHGGRIHASEGNSGVGRFVQNLNDKGEWTCRTRVIHIDPRREGHFAVVAPPLIKEKPPVLLVETQFLELAAHAE